MKRTSLIPVSLDFCCWRKNAIACDVCVAASAQCVERDVEAKIGEYNSPSSKKQRVAQLVISQWGAFAVDSAPARVSCRCPGGTPKREEEETWSTGRGGRE